MWQAHFHHGSTSVGFADAPYEGFPVVAFRGGDDTAVVLSSVSGDPEPCLVAREDGRLVVMYGSGASVTREATDYPRVRKEGSKEYEPSYIAIVLSDSHVSVKAVTWPDRVAEVKTVGTVPYKGKRDSRGKIPEHAIWDAYDGSAVEALFPKVVAILRGRTGR